MINKNKLYIKIGIRLKHYANNIAASMPKIEEEDEAYLPSEKSGNATGLLKKQEVTKGEGRRGRHTLKSEDKETQRYECFCLNQYLSYVSLYGHVKKKHPDFFEANRHFGKQNILITFDPIHTYKIMKLLKEKVHNNPTSSQQLLKQRREKIQKADENRQMAKLKRPQTEYQQLQIHLHEGLTKSDILKRQLQINRKIVAMYYQLMENLQQVAEGYERAIKLLKIKEVNDLLNGNQPKSKKQKSE